MTVGHINVMVRKLWKLMLVPVAITASLQLESQSRAAAPSSCPSTYLCVYTAVSYNPNFARSNIYYSNTDWGYYPLPVKNKDFSWFNNGTQNVCVFHGNYTIPGGFYLTVPLTMGTGYTSGNPYNGNPAYLPFRARGKSNKWIGSQGCNSFQSNYV